MMNNSIEIKTVLQFFGDQKVSKINQEELEAVVTAWERVTPLVIEELNDDDVFVFGSNTNGYHSARASKMAMERFGAEDKKGEGLSGRSYALPTTEITKPCDTVEERKSVKKKEYRKFSKDEIRPYVDSLLKCVKENPGKNFYITRVACGFSNKTDATIAPLFKEFVKCKNVYLPKLFLYEIFKKEQDIVTPTDLAIVKSGGPDEFVKQLDEQLSMYIRWVAKHRQENKYSVKVVDMVERVCSAIASAVAMYYRGLPAEAYGMIADIFGRGDEGEKDKDRYLNIEDYLTPVTDGQFYRMRRETDSWKRKEIGKDDMYHIPFGLRGIVSTQRYSIPGFPCMYIGCSEEGCWEELGRPNKNECVLSEVNIKEGKSFCALDLTIPTADSWTTTDEDLEKVIKFFPFVIACTFKPSKVGDTFKPEYVIPQLLLQYVKDYGYRCNRSVLDADKQIYGVKYTSVHVDKNKLGDVGNQYVNYVIPVTSIDNDYCRRIKDTFDVAEPQMCENEQFIHIS